MRRQLKLSAALKKTPMPRRSIAWLVDDVGAVHRIDSQGCRKCWSMDLASPVVQVVASGTSEVWIRCANGVVLRFHHAIGCWVETFRVNPGEFLAGAHLGGVWICGLKLQLAGAPASRPQVKSPPFQINALSHGHDGTIWVLGQKKLFGGNDVWRYSLDLAAWVRLPPPAAASKISGARDGTAWTVSSRGDIWRLHPDGAGSFRECGLEPDCRNCMYSPPSMHVVDMQVDPDDVLWVIGVPVSKRHEECRVGILRDFATRRYEWLASDLSVISIAAERGADSSSVD